MPSHALQDAVINRQFGLASVGQGTEPKVSFNLDNYGNAVDGKVQVPVKEDIPFQNKTLRLVNKKIN